MKTHLFQKLCSEKYDIEKTESDLRKAPASNSLRLSLTFNKFLITFM